MKHNILLEMSVVIPVGYLIGGTIIGIVFIFLTIFLTGKHRAKQIKRRNIEADITAIRIRPIGESQTEIEYSLETVKKIAAYIDETIPYVNLAGHKKLHNGFYEADQKLISLTEGTLTGKDLVMHNELRKTIDQLSEKMERKKMELKSSTSTKPTLVQAN